jgi:mono/diheme cytochrome c family protein
MKRIGWVALVAIIFLLFCFGTVFGQPKNPPKKSPELVTQGKKLYEQNCMPCHGIKGDGKGPAGIALKPVPTDFTKSFKEWPITKGDQQKIFEVISKGILNTGMVKWDQFPEQERWALTYGVMEFAPAAKAPPAKKK